MMDGSKSHHNGHGHGHHGGVDDDGFAGIEPETIGLNIPFGPFVSVVAALLAVPAPGLPIAAGENGPSTAQSSLFWTYDAHTGLHVQTAPGFLTTASGDGGFSLNVRPDGAWALKFDGSGTAANPVIGFDTISGGIGDYMIGGSGTGGGGPGGNGNCAIYTDSAGPVLVDMQNGFGYGGTAEGNVLVNMNQVRGSFFTNVLIGNANGTDLKS